MSKKTPAVAYYNRKIKTTSKSVLITDWQNAPITKLDFKFMLGIIDGLSYKELADIFGKSVSRIYQWKRSLFEKLHQYDMARLH